MDFPRVPGDELPWITADQMRELDRLAIEAGYELPVMMENAGRSLADVAMALAGSVRDVEVLVGVGGNGGGAAVAARHLAHRGWDVRLVPTDRSRLGNVTARQIELAQLAGATVSDDGELSTGLVLDGLLGYGLVGVPRGSAADLIAQAQGRRVVALDVPSGLELETGTVHDPVLRADVTLTLALPKQGLRGGRDVVGRLLLADIGIPRSAYEQLGIARPDAFAVGAVVELDPW